VRRKIIVYWVPPELLTDYELQYLDWSLHKLADSLAMGNLNRITAVWWNNVGSLTLFHNMIESDKFGRQMGITQLPNMRNVSKVRRKECGLVVDTNMVREGCNELISNCIEVEDFDRLITISQFKLLHQLGEIPWITLNEEGIITYKKWRKSNGKTWEVSI